MRLMVSPNTLRRARDDSTERGMERAMIKVLFQEPRKSRIINAVSAAAISPSLTTPFTAVRTKSDWSANSLASSSGGRPLNIFGMAFLTPATTLRVDAAPLLKMVSSTPRTPFSRTTFCCGW